MATRPVFCSDESTPFVKRMDVAFKWYPGFAVSQKQKSIDALHRATVATRKELVPLEVSSKSPDHLGVSLSAFNLKIKGIPLECVFQSAKNFSESGCHHSWIDLHPRDAKKCAAVVNEKEHLIGFKYENIEFGLEPKTFFYDWIYLRAVIDSGFDIDQIAPYNCFTDIEFNPAKSINCQALSVALLKSLTYSMSWKNICEMNVEDFRAYYEH